MNYSDCSKKVRKSFKYVKPFWNENLTNLWKIMRDAEKAFLKSSAQSRKYLHNDFKTKQRLFYKSLRKAERNNFYNFADTLETINTKDPKAFWKHIKKLGPANKSQIPMVIHNADGFENYKHQA